MNILFVHEISYLRDPIFEIHALAELLSLRGHNVYAVDYGATRYREMDVTRVYPDAKVRLIRPPSFKFSRLCYCFIYYSIIYKVLLEKKIDVVVLYSAPTNGIQTITTAKKLGIPVVFRSIDTLHKLTPAILTTLTKQAERWVYRHADEILTITPALSRYVESFGAPADRIKILPLGVDVQCCHKHTERATDAFYHKNSTDCRILVFAGTLPSFSGLGNLIKQMPELISQVKGLKLLIVGDGVQRSTLEKMIRDKDLVDSVTITGMVPHKEVPAWIAGADIGVLTFPVEGATRDIFPTKVLQYMACGIPIVTNPLPGLVDCGLGEEQGVVYVENSDWGSAIKYALQNKDILGKKARIYVEQEHEYSKIVSRLEGELKTLCRSH